MCNFIEKCVNDTAQPDEIDHYIDQWHTGNIDTPIHIYLGMSLEEYRAWIETPDVLPTIIAAHNP